MEELVDARPLDPSARWADALRADDSTRAEGLSWLRAHLAAAATFEFDRRGIGVHGAQSREVTSLVRDAAEAALEAILADLDRYRRQSRFTTWTAKYAIREAAAVARERAAAPAGDY